MIRVCKKIKRVGRFVDFSSQGEDFRELTLIYGENGSGKTTLARLFRSLGTGDTNILQALHTFGKSDPARVKISTDQGNAVLSNWAWSSTIDGIKIYDSTFIYDNVFAGDVVENRHKTNMYRLVVGEKGVELSRQEEELKKTVKSLKDKLDSIGLKIKNKIESDLDIDDYVEIEKDGKIDNRIENKKSELERAKSIKNILTKDGLKSIDGVDISTDLLEDVLEESIDDVSRRAREKVQDHLDEHLGSGAERWVERGYKYSGEEGDECPYCGQDTTGVDLVEAYDDYFSDEYDELKKKISRRKDEVVDKLGAQKLGKIRETLNVNNERFNFWSDHIEGDLPNLGFDEVEQVWKNTREEVINNIERKDKNVLESISISEELKSALEEFKRIKNRIEKYNDKIDKLNSKIESAKEDTEKGDRRSIRRELDKLKDVKNRHKEHINALCATYKKVDNEIERAKSEREEARKKSDKHTKRVFEEYEKDINNLLDKFGANFGVSDIRASRRGKRVSSKYDIEVGGEYVGLEGSGVEEGDPEFRTALSIGDRNTLAFTLFCVKMRNLSLDDKIVIIDDPVTSLDIHREENAAREIIKIANEAQQAIVLSHNPHFLNVIRNHRKNGLNNQLLKVNMKGEQSVVREWDINEDLRNAFRRDVNKIKSFVHNGQGEEMSVLRSIRPMLETYIQVVYQGEVNPNDTIGSYIDDIKGASGNDPLTKLQGVVDELEDIKDFTDPYMHGSASPRPKPPQHNLVESYASRALDIIAP